jgi:phosphoglycerol transferase MdoB-like AlkP superfamily enzyme
MKLFEQHNIKRIGALLNVLYLTMPLFGIIAYAMSAATLYTVTLPYVQPIMPWLSLPVFFSFIVVIAIIMMYCNYKFLYPSYFTFLNKQTYIHNNPMMEDLQKIKKKLGIID